MKYNIVIVGVGGQGTLLASKILGGIALSQGLDVKVSEIHGMAQRGGSVITHVRMGDEVFAPLVSPGEADYILAFEWLEALRSEYFLKEDGLLIANTQRIMPMPVILGDAPYPEQEAAVKCLCMDAYHMACEAGSARSVNMVLLGVLSKFLPFEQEVWEETIEKIVPPKTLDTNYRAFRAGRDIAHKQGANV
jgi:indolepyruvate ferredoxin oxidoreductase beta subunit